MKRILIASLALISIIPLIKAETISKAPWLTSTRIGPVADPVIYPSSSIRGPSLEVPQQDLAKWHTLNAQLQQAKVQDNQAQISSIEQQMNSLYQQDPVLREYLINSGQIQQ